jgi:hemoglobin-like flavoprotein
MTPEQITVVQQTWQSVTPIQDTAAQLFYSRLFELDPSLRLLFKGDMTEQQRKLMTMIGTAVNALNRIESIVPAVRNLGRRHGAYGVREEHYDTVANALLWTLEQGLGPTFTAEARDAWIAVYQVLAGTMKAAHA